MSKKNKIIIVGLPRSGTTIITNYINSMDNAFCFIEPHWEYERTKKTKFFNDKKLKKIWWLKYYKNKKLPLNEAIDKILKKYDIVGFKETYRSNVYSKIEPQIINEYLINNYKKNGYKTIGIVRNPIDVWNSFKSYDPSPKSWGGNINLFLRNYKKYIDSIKNVNPIIYEKFIESPIKELEKKNLPIMPIKKIRVRKIKIGDDRANESQKIIKKNKTIYYSPKERDLILNDSIMNEYLKIKDKRKKMGTPI